MLLVSTLQLDRGAYNDGSHRCDIFFLCSLFLDLDGSTSASTTFLTSRSIVIKIQLHFLY